MSFIELRKKALATISNLSESTPLKQKELTQITTNIFSQWIGKKVYILDLNAFRGRYTYNRKQITGSPIILDDVARSLKLKYNLFAYEIDKSNFESLQTCVQLEKRGDTMLPINKSNYQTSFNLVAKSEADHNFIYADYGGTTDWDMLRIMSRFDNVHILVNLNVTIQKRFASIRRCAWYHRLCDDIRSLKTKHSYISYIKKSRPSWTWLYFTNKALTKKQANDFLLRTDRDGAQYLEEASYTQKERLQL